MNKYRFARDCDTVVIDASNRRVAEKRAKRELAKRKGIDIIGEVLVSCPENSTVKKHFPTGEQT